MKKSVEDMTDLEKWAVFFSYANEPNQRETVNKVIESKEVLKMAGNVLMSISQDERERAVFRSRRMYQTDYQSDIATAEDRCRAEGRAAGRAEEKFALAKRLLRRGRPIEEIAEDTELTYEEVAALKKQSRKLTSLRKC